MKTDNIKQEMGHDTENLRKKNETEIQNKMEGHSSRLEQAEDRISEFEDEMVIKRKTEELLDNSSPAKGICKNSLTLSKDQTCESWALKKEKRCKQKELVIHSAK
jgi:hypothetical protein